MNSQPEITKLNNLIFDNRFIRELPADTETVNNRRQVVGACYSQVLPTPVANPQRVAYSREVAELLDLTTDACESDDFIQVFAGNRLAAGMEPYATCYGGHQFGNWAGQLGDGRAINLGEVINRKGERWALQLKGAGPTPYSRNADGLAVLRSSVREFLCSEAMYHLGVPTTRALSLMLTGEPVIRDMFYNGNPKAEPGAVVCRVAPSFTRFGNFQILTARK
ncbi:MAG TPA: protein adenylyltransferase SelO family protein, partial [Methylococcales bacterium]